MASVGPWCEDIDHDDRADAPQAVALVPLTSTGMPTPYRWMLVCAECLPQWRNGVAARDLPTRALMLVPGDI